MADKTTPKTPLAGKVALVTGGARRVGRAVALGLAEAGMDVAITFNTSAEAARQLVMEIQRMGRRACAIKMDLAQADAGSLLYQRFTEHFDRLDALVNNASVFEPSPFSQITPDFYDRTMAVNARTPLLLIQELCPNAGGTLRSK